MSYGADFANADPANAPLNGPLFIGADPFFWGAILLGLVAALLLGWYMGARSNTRRSDAAQAIWKAVQEAARSAMGSDDNALKGRAETLRKVIDERLGKTLKLAGGLSGRIKKLDDAIAGKGPVQPGGGGGGVQTPPRAGGGSGGDAAQGGSGQGGSGGGGGGAAAASAANVTVVTIGGPATTAPQPPPTTPPTIGDLSHREQTDALRLAVSAFNEHWRDEGARVGELRAAHAELSNPGSANKSSGHGKVSHGGH